LSSAEHRSNSSLHLPQATLSTHKEESEDDSIQQQAYENELVKISGVRRRQDAASSASQQKNVVDLIQVIILISTSEFCNFVKFH
jgi:pumilio RNA-binding family